MGEVEPADVLPALARDETAGPVLAELGIDEPAIRRALAARRAAGTSALAGNV
jgi:Clp amino terminal domain, pathogenicity island component